MSALLNTIKYFPSTNIKKLNINSFSRIYPEIKLFDVTLRDGLQSEKKIYSVKEKYEIFKNIVKYHNPESIEVGSIVNSKILPQMKNSIELFNYIEENNKDSIIPIPDLYMLVPSEKSLKIAMENNINNFSFITSVSDEFQIKNTNSSLNETRNNISKMINTVKKNTFLGNNHKVKLYLSCIEECPISGYIDIGYIIEEIMYYYVNHKNDISEICLSDTCGTLRFDTFKHIIDILLLIHNIDLSKFSLHLHVNDNNIGNISNIINLAYNQNISSFDVSFIKDIGGCTVTIEKNKCNRNLTYNDVYNLIE